MQHTALIPSPDRSYSLTVVIECLEIDEPEYKASICVKVIDVEKDYNEQGEVVLPEWVTVDYINSIRL